MSLRLLTPRVLPGNVAFWFGVLLCAGSCKISQPSNDSPDACAIGELCGDAGSTDAISTTPVTPAPTLTDAATRDAAVSAGGVCPGECLPDDLAAKECAEPVVITSKAFKQIVADGGANASVDASLLSDAGQSDGGYPDASVGSPSDSDASDVELLDGSVDGAPSQSSGGGNGSRPVDPLPGLDSTGKDNAKAKLSCQLVSVDGALRAGCAESGQGVEGSVCTSAKDCSAGFGCVGRQGAGQCLPYCCGGNEACGDNRYCDLRPMRSLELDEQASSIPQVPVCVAAEQCSLDVAITGERDAQGPTSCPQGSACTIVRANTTACQPMGRGGEGQACPCSGGHFCSKVTNTCLKLCNTADPSSCGQRGCQPGPSGFPEGFGLCVGN
jgi:hypothetical protein